MRAIRLEFMPGTRLLLVMLGTLLLLADGIALRHAAAFPHPTAAVLLGLVIGQLGLIASWAACSRRMWLLRVAVVWGCAALAAWPISAVTAPSWRAWAGLLLIFALLVAAAWKLLLAAGYRWANVDRAEQRVVSRLQSHQFSLAWMMQATTALALALGVGSWLALPAVKPHLAVASIAILALFIPLVISTLLLHTPRWWLRGVLALIVPLGCAVFMRLSGGSTPMFMTLLLGVEVLVALATATVLASLGVALVPVKASTAEVAPRSSPRLADAL